MEQQLTKPTCLAKTRKAYKSLKGVIRVTWLKLAGRGKCTSEVSVQWPFLWIERHSSVYSGRAWFINKVNLPLQQWWCTYSLTMNMKRKCVFKREKIPPSTNHFRFLWDPLDSQHSFPDHSFLQGMPKAVCSYKWRLLSCLKAIQVEQEFDYT